MKFSESQQKFYDSFHPSIPEDAINITNEQHLIMLSEKNNEQKWHTVNNNTITSHTPVVYWTSDGTKLKTNYNQQVVPPDCTTTMPDCALEECKKCTKAQLRKNIDEIKKQITIGYSQGEQDTWMQQVQEAKAYQDDNTIADSKIPFLVSAIAVDTSKTKDSLSSAIINNDIQFRFASGNIVGQRMVIDSLIQAATTYEELEAIDLTITAPTISLTDK